MRLKRLISAFITCAMLVTLMPMQAFAAPKDIFNDTEFHIMQMDEIKNFVREANNLFNDADIKIYGINVHGLDKNGKPATVNGNITDWTKWNTTIGDLGWQGSNGKLANDDWMVLNINGITVLDQSSVDSITIFAKNDKNQLTTTAYLGEGDLHAPTQVSGKLITEIYLNNATPVPQFTLTYDANGGTGKLPEATLYPQDEPVTVNDGAGLTRDKAVFLGFSETQKDPITQEADCPELLTEVTMTKDTTLYAVWAEDENKNGEPDYNENWTLTYDANGGQGAPAPETGLKDENKWHELSKEKPTHDPVGETPILFVGWTLDEYNRSILTKDSTNIPEFSETVCQDRDKTVYAIWAEDSNKNGEPDYQEKAITVTFDAKNDSVEQKTFTVQPFTTDVSYAPEVTAPTDKVLDKWELSTDSSKTLGDKAPFTYDSIHKIANGADQVTFEAVYKDAPASTIKVAYVVDENKGTATGELTETVTIAVDGTATLNAPEVEGKVYTDSSGYVFYFEGWAADNGATVTKAEDGSYVLSGIQADKTYTLTAQCDRSLIWADVSGGHGKIQLEIRESDDKTVISRSEPSIEITLTYNQVQAEKDKGHIVYLKSIPDDGYGFAGWDSTLFNERVSADPFCVNNFNMEKVDQMYAHFNPLLNVKFDAGEHGTLAEGQENNQTVVSDYWASNILFPELVVEDGYKLTGWKNNKDDKVYDGPINNISMEWDGAIFTAQYEEIKNPIEKIDITFGENLVKENPDLNKYDILHAEYDNQYILMTGGKGHFTTPWIADIWHPIPDSLTTVVDTPEEAQEFFSGFTAMKTLALWDKTWLGDDLIVDVRVDGSTMYLTLDKEPTTKEITLNIYDVVNGKQVEERTMTVPVDATAVNTSDITLPEGYEFTVTGDLPINDNNVYVEVKPVVTTKEVTLNIYDIVNHEQVKEEKMTVAADATYVNTGDIDLPEGYEFTVTGDLPIRDNNVYVEVRPVETGKAIVNIRFMDGDEFVAGGDYPFEDGESVQFGDLELPEGYELDTEKNSAEDGFMARDGAQIIVHVKKAETDVIMNIRFVDEDTDEFIAGGDYFLPAGVQNYSILEKYVPDGYEMTVSGDFTVTADGKLDVPVKKIAVEPGDVIMNIRFMYGDEFVAGGDYFIPEGVQNYSILEKYVPEGYRMAVSGDFMAVNGGKLDVPLEKIDAETVPVTIQYFHGKDLVKEVHREMTEGVHSYRELEQDVPEGYTMAVAGDFYAKKDAVIVVDLTKEEVAEYKVTVNGSYANNSGEGKYAPGDEVTIKAGSRDDYSFDGWESDDVTFTDADSRTTTFIMPAWNVTVTATWDRDSGGGGAHHPDAGDDDDDDNDRDDDTEEIIDGEVPLAETPWLNTEDHYAYVVGYSEDGTVRPNANITRAEVATIFFRLLTDNARDQFWMTSNNFSDVLPNDWYNTAVSTMVNMGIIQGYEDGTFRPNANITRAEFATIAARFLASGYEVEDDLFGDIAAHWARESINDAAMAGWINGYEDGTFRPDAAITRAEAVTMVNNVLGRKPDADHMLDSMIKWTDNMDTSAWYYEAIQEATNSHDYDLFEGAEYETWTALQENRDWSALEKDWANAHVA